MMRSKNLTFRIRKDLDERLKKAAAVNDRSISEEIELRLQRSFWKECSGFMAIWIGKRNANKIYPRA